MSVVGKLVRTGVQLATLPARTALRIVLGSRPGDAQRKRAAELRRIADEARARARARRTAEEEAVRAAHERARAADRREARVDAAETATERRREDAEAEALEALEDTLIARPRVRRLDAANGRRSRRKG